MRVLEGVIKWADKLKLLLMLIVSVIFSYSCVFKIKYEMLFQISISQLNPLMPYIAFSQQV